MADKIQKEDLCSILMKESTMPDTEIHKILDAFFMQIMKGLEEERYVRIKGLGVFKLIDVESRRSVDVNTKEYIEIPEHRKITFTPESALKELINKPFAHFETIELKSEVPLDKTSSNIEKETEDNQMDEETEGNKVNEGINIAVSEEIQDNTPTTEEEVKIEDSVAVKPQDTFPPQAPVRLIERREELRKLDKQLEEENRKNKIALTIISILMFLVLLSGLLFILAPEFLEQLLY